MVRLLSQPIPTPLSSPVSFSQGVRLLAFCLLLAFLNPPPLLITVGPEESVKSTHPIVGVHTRLTDEVEEWKIQRSLQMVRQMGASWIVEFFPWAYYQGESRGIDWHHPDMVMRHASAQGLRVIARIGLTPEWARPPDTPLNYLDETAFADFAAFAASFAERYEGQLDYMVVGNEPNLSYEWGYRINTPETYVELLKSVYPAVKQANPEIILLAGALAPTLEAPGSQWGLNDLLYLQGIYQAGGASYFDALAVHSYGLTFPPSAAPGPEILNFRRVELLRQVMVENNDADKKIFITEMGWNDHPRWTRAVRPGQRISYTLEALRFAEENWDYVEMAAIWVFRYPAPTKSYMDYYTMVTPEFIEKPIYQEVKKYTGN